MATWCPFFDQLHGIWPCMFMAWYLAKKLRETICRFLDFFICFFTSCVLPCTLPPAQPPEPQRAVSSTQQHSVPFLGSSTLCGCQKVSAPRKTASRSLPLLIPILSVILGLLCPLSNVWKLLFHSLVQLSDPKSGIHHTIKVQKWSLQFPDVNTTILALLRLLGIWNIFPDFFI